MGPGDLTQVLAPLPRHADPRLLVGHETFDDAGIFRIDDGLALVQTVDFFAPVVDDPFTFGQVAAANALSDVYAMGGEPLTALSIVGFPRERLPLSVLTEILRGAQDKVREAGASFATVVKTTVFLQDMADFPRVNEVYARAFGDARPARSTVAVVGLPRNVLVEIEAVAVVG